MDLKTFVRETLKELDSALSEASNEFETHNYKFGRNASGNNSIDFEVQIYASEGTGSSGNIGAGINVAGIQLGASTKGQTNKVGHELSKISFSVVQENTHAQNNKEAAEFSKYNPIIEHKNIF